MADSIENLLARNLHDVFGERDPARRTAAIEFRLKLMTAAPHKVPESHS
jgi:hypothetical protein